MTGASARGLTDISGPRGFVQGMFCRLADSPYVLHFLCARASRNLPKSESPKVAVMSEPLPSAGSCPYCCGMSDVVLVARRDDAALLFHCPHCGETWQCEGRFDTEAAAFALVELAPNGVRRPTAEEAARYEGLVPHPDHGVWEHQLDDLLVRRPRAPTSSPSAVVSPRPQRSASRCRLPVSVSTPSAPTPPPCRRGSDGSKISANFAIVDRGAWAKRQASKRSPANRAIGCLGGCPVTPPVAGAPARLDHRWSRWRRRRDRPPPRGGPT